MPPQITPHKIPAGVSAAVYQQAAAATATHRAHVTAQVSSMTTAASTTQAEREEAARREAGRKRREEEADKRAEARAQYQKKQAQRREHMRPERIAEATQEQWVKLFDSVGLDVIYNAIAVGFTATAFAIERGYPPFYFRKWCQENLDRKQVVEAHKAAAELAAYESAAMFDDPDSRSSMQAVHHVRAHAQHKFTMAERRDAETWGPPKAVPPQQPPVSLVISIDGGAVPQEHHDKIAAKRADKLLRAEPFFDPRSKSARPTGAEDAEDAEVVDD